MLTSADEVQLSHVAGLSVGIMSASQGRYSPTQLVLDISQGGRVGSSVYSRRDPPALRLAASGTGGRIDGWEEARRRASDAPQLLEPGLLAAELQGRVGYVGSSASAQDGAIAAADRDGRVGAVSLGTAASLLQRIGAMAAREPLVVVDLPNGAEGVAALRALAGERQPSGLLIAVQRVPAGRPGQLLWLGAAGIGPRGELTSKSTNERGLVVSADITTTILEHLGRRTLPQAVKGKALETDGSVDEAGLRSLMARLHVVGPRRLRALALLLLGWALLLALAAAMRDLRGPAIRAGAIGVLWAPVVVLVTAAIAPSAAVEYTVVALGCLGLGALTDVLIPWPRAPIVPAIAALLALSADALAHTQLLVRSLLGPNPILGARFYGIGNELKSAPAVLVLAALAAALQPAARGRRAASAMAIAGVVLAVIEGSARIGAGVGGVILVAAGFAVATIMLLPGAVTRRRALAAVLAPIAGLVVLAAIDLLTAHGSGHYTGSVLHARSAGELRDLIVRRYKAAWGELRNHGMPVATALCLACAVVGVRRRERLLSPVAGDPGWLAAFAGALTAAVVGALAEDSGPVLLVVGVFVLSCVASYLWAPEPPLTRRSRGTRREARSRALPPPAEPER